MIQSNGPAFWFLYFQLLVTFGGLGAAGLSASLLTSVLPTTSEDLLALGLCSAGGYVHLKLLLFVNVFALLPFRSHVFSWCIQIYIFWFNLAHLYKYGSQNLPC